MKILIDIRGVWPRHSGGIENYAVTAIRALASRGHEVVVDVNPLFQDEYCEYFSAADSVTVVADRKVLSFSQNYYNSGGLRRAVVRAVRFLLRRIGRDPIRRQAWANSHQADVVMYPFHRDELQHTRLPVVTTVHAYLPEYTARDHQIIEEHAKKAEALLVSWPGPFADLVNRFPERKQDCFIVPFTILQNITAEAPAPPSGIAKNDVFFFYPSNVIPRKNHLCLVEAYQLAAEKGIDLPMTVCSGGGDQALRHEVAEQLKAHHLEGKIVFPGYVSEEEMTWLYQNCLGTVSTSEWEAGMAVFQEGGYWAKPSASSDILPAREHAKMLELDAAFFDPHQPATIVSALESLVSERERFSESAQVAQRAIRAMDDQYFARCLEDVFSFAAKQSSSPAWQPYLPPTL